MKYIVCVCVLIPSFLFGQTNSGLFIEALPDQVQARMEVKARAAANARRNGQRNTAEYYMFFTKRWLKAPSQPITVAFNGGTDDLRSKIAAIAAGWSNGGVSFDFRDPAGHFRQWSRSDIRFQADIRVGFDGVEGSGYWSLIGSDSSDPTVIAPNQASLEFQGFDSALPPEWEGVVRHEFGHALGLMHEHQTPVGGCDQDFKWQDDSGYVPTQDINGQYVNDSQGRRPGIYTLLAGYPNFWPKEKVDSNMRQLNIDSHNYDFGPFDPLSIMKYYFDPSFFVSGTAAHCYSPRNTGISPDDRTGIGKWYPAMSSDSLRQLLNEQSAFIESLKAFQNMKAVELAK